VRDLDDLLVSDEESQRRATQAQQTATQQADQQTRLMEANIAKIRAEEYKGMTQGDKNTTTANASTIDAAMGILDKGNQQLGLTPPPPPPQNINGDEQGGAGPAPQGIGGA
jgi:hypothetical protein